MTQSAYTKIAQLKSVEDFRNRLDALGINIPCDDHVASAASGSPLAKEIKVGDFRVGNRWCIHPMEGWDANRDGSPSDLTRRRWRQFGASGAKLIWGGEAAAVCPAGRANPNQTMAVPSNEAGLFKLRTTLVEAHEEAVGNSDDLMIGLQLTHSGRFCRPNSKALEPKIAYHNPLLDRKFGIDSSDATVVMTDKEVDRLIDDYVTAANLAEKTGFQFVDVKSCHGYLLHEFLSARSRPGRYGGDYSGRTHLLKSIIAGIRGQCPNLMIGVRLSVFDMPPFQDGGGNGEPMPYHQLLPYQIGFGVNEDDPLQMDLSEPLRLIRELKELGVVALNVSAGSPYYNPHMQRPAIFPPSDGYQPPEDPLVGVARQIQAARACKAAVPDLPMVGSGYSYLQDYLPHVCQALVRDGWIDIVGLGRMVLSYPQLPLDTLRGSKLERKKLCRTFSDCTTAPRNGMVSGCFPLDPFYKRLPEASRLREIKRLGN